MGMPAPATLSVDLNALVANYRTLEAVGGAPVHPVVKADSYGLGAEACARRLMAEGARTFFVARTGEGERLRAALGPEPAIYVLDGCLTGRAARLRGADLKPVLNTGAQLADWRAAGGGACGLQIDTGMNRLGFRLEDAPEPFAGLALVMSHLACADDPAAPMNARQRDAFAAAAARYPGTVRSFANSGGAFLGRDYAFDALRPGVCLYGGDRRGGRTTASARWRPCQPRCFRFARSRPARASAIRAVSSPRRRDGSRPARRAMPTGCYGPTARRGRSSSGASCGRSWGGCRWTSAPSM